MNLSNPQTLTTAIQELKSCPHLSPVIAVHEAPTFELVKNPFRALTRIITFQQLSGKAAETIFRRLITLIAADDDMTPEHILAQDVETLRSVGLSRQKATYITNIAHQFESFQIAPEQLHTMSDEQIRATLLPIKGVGAWTVEMFLMFNLCRPDIFSPGDLGLQKALQPMMNVEKPRANYMVEFATRWQPYRTVASYYLWRSLEEPSIPQTPRSIN